MSITASTGPLFRIGTVTLNPDKGDGPIHLNPTEVAAFGMKPGAPAQAEAVLTAGAALQTALTEEGYALAHVSTRRPGCALPPIRSTLPIRCIAARW